MVLHLRRLLGPFSTGTQSIAVLTVIGHLAADALHQRLPARLLARLEQAAHRVGVVSPRGRPLFRRFRRCAYSQVSLILTVGLRTGGSLIVNNGQGGARSTGAVLGRLRVTTTLRSVRQMLRLSCGHELLLRRLLVLGLVRRRGGQELSLFVFISGTKSVSGIVLGHSELLLIILLLEMLQIL